MQEQEEDHHSALVCVAFYNVNTLSEPLAYQHSEMLEKAINMFEGYPNLKKYERK